jgi:hypothetical protein
VRGWAPRDRDTAGKRPDLTKKNLTRRTQSLFRRSSILRRHMLITEVCILAVYTRYTWGFGLAFVYP